MKKKCECCEKEFEVISTKPNRVKYCSNACNNRAYRLRNKDEFNKRRREKYRRPHDNERIRAENKRSYQQHQEERIMEQRQYRIDHPEQRIKINKHLSLLRKIHKQKWYSRLFCDQCESEQDIVFHHVDPTTKKYEISRMFKNNSLEILAEMAKCNVLCHSCHNQLHANLQWGN